MFSLLEVCLCVFYLWYHVNKSITLRRAYKHFQCSQDLFWKSCISPQQRKVRCERIFLLKVSKAQTCKNIALGRVGGRVACVPATSSIDPPIMSQVPQGKRSVTAPSVIDSEP